jgi:cysteine desulfurase
MSIIYLDYNATTPIDKEVAQCMQPYLQQYFGNPSSSHNLGMEAKQAVEKARKQLADLLCCHVDEIVFTSGGTESNNYAIKGVAMANRQKGNHIITSKIEHPAVIEVCKYLEKNGFEITYAEVDEYGIVDPKSIEKEIRASTILITIMHANNETGSIQPIAEISRIAKSAGIVFHSDAAQSIGKIESDVNKLGVDLLSVAGHKLYAPKGTGALFIRRGIKLEKLIHGADHEQNLRAGTENVLEIVGLGKAAEIAKRDLLTNQQKFSMLRDALHEQLKKEIPALKLNGHPEKRLPNTLNLSFKNTEANTLLSELENIAASAGAACHADNVKVSSVLEAMKVPIEYAMGAIRFSVGRLTSKADIEEASKEIIEKVRQLTSDEQISSNRSEVIKLTQFTHGLGCACKIRPQYLERILKDLKTPQHPDIIVGNQNSDDAAVYKINEETAIVQTLDFFTPVVDDPYHFGQIAAANSLSDIYAMGAKALFALNIVGFPDKRLPEHVLKDILKGAEDKAAEAGISILGGHSVEDNEPKFGMVVTGSCHPEKLWTNAGAQEGDVLILTKALGTGILSTAMKRGLLNTDQYQSLYESMSQLNANAANIASTYEIHACTDITGFGLLGHLSELTTASDVSAEIFADKPALMDAALEFATSGIIPGGSKNNLDFVLPKVDFAPSVPEVMKFVLADAQTSGGLLFSVKASDANALLQDLKKSGILANQIGYITEKKKSAISVK